MRWAWRSTGSKRGGSGPWLASSSAERIVTASQWRRCSTRRSVTSGSCRWRSSCSASGPGPRSSASLWRCGGRDDERDDLRGDGAMCRHPAGVSGLGALALGALRAAGAGTPPGGPGAGAAGAAAEAIGRAAAGGDSCRSRSVPVPRRRPSQGPRTASDPGWDPSRPHAGAARHAGARTALPAPRASGRREDLRREGHHPGAQRDVGDGRRAGIHARRRVGLDLRGGRTLERGVRGVARVQSREPLRGTRSDCARARTSLWLAGRRRRPRAGASDGSR